MLRRFAALLPLLMFFVTPARAYLQPTLEVSAPGGSGSMSYTARSDAYLKDPFVHVGKGRYQFAWLEDSSGAIVNGWAYVEGFTPTEGIRLASGDRLKKGSKYKVVLLSDKPLLVGWSIYLEGPTKHLKVTTALRPLAKFNTLAAATAEVSRIPLTLGAKSTLIAAWPAGSLDGLGTVGRCLTQTGGYCKVNQAYAPTMATGVLQFWAPAGHPTGTADLVRLRAAEAAKTTFTLIY